MVGKRDAVLRVRDEQAALPDGLGEHPGVVGQSAIGRGPVEGEREFAIFEAAPSGDENGFGTSEVHVFHTDTLTAPDVGARSVRENRYVGHGPPGHGAKWAAWR
ncbi:hypothetical protein GCM10010392_27430 [Streptomyces clavifer]|nr:hypothetical protein GCM10010392_27430 [Streptomyces clavifer]